MKKIICLGLLLGLAGCVTQTVTVSNGGTVYMLNTKTVTVSDPTATVGLPVL
ncbi:MAG: hypothetical protein WC047_00475 [Kiritimatiellales bacterium]